MGNSVFYERAEHLVQRLAKADLKDPKAFAEAVSRVERVLMNATAGQAWNVLVSELEERARLLEVAQPDTVKYAEVRGLRAAAARLKETATAYAYPTLDAWWETTAYQDAITADDAAFRDKPIHLKRIALEAFNAARRTAGVGVEIEQPSGG